MAIKMTMSCTRCHREDHVELATLAEASALEELQKRKVVTLKKIQDFLATIKPDEMPDFLAIVGEKNILHNYLCDPKDGKRSCTQRVDDLMTQVNELGERKPRTKKAKADGSAVTSAEPDDEVENRA